jgi:hypothetical protein
MTNRIQVRYSPFRLWGARVWFNHAWREVPGLHKTKGIAVLKAAEHLEILLSEREADGEWHDVEEWE